MNKKRMKKVASSEVVKKATGYTAMFKVGTEEFRAEGATLIEALDNLAPRNIRSKATLTVSFGDKFATQAFWPNLIRRFTMNKIYRQILAKRLEINPK